MADQINGYGRAGPDIGSTRAQAVKRPQAGADAPPGPRAGGAADAVELTGTAARLKAIEARLAGMPEVDEARVKVLRDRLESGEYRPDAARIATKLMQMDKVLG